MNAREREDYDEIIVMMFSYMTEFQIASVVERLELMQEGNKEAATSGKVA